MCGGTVFLTQLLASETLSNAQWLDYSGPWTMGMTHQGHCVLMGLIYCCSPTDCHTTGPPKNPHTAPDRPTHYPVPQLGFSRTLTLPPTDLHTACTPGPHTDLQRPTHCWAPQTHRPLGCTPLGLDEAFTGTWQPGKGALLGAWLGAFQGSSLLPAVSTPT